MGHCISFYRIHDTYIHAQTKAVLSAGIRAGNSALESCVEWFIWEARKQRMRMKRCHKASKRKMCTYLCMHVATNPPDAGRKNPALMEICFFWAVVADCLQRWVLSYVLSYHSPRQNDQQGQRRALFASDDHLFSLILFRTKTTSIYL